MSDGGAAGIESGCQRGLITVPALIAVYTDQQPSAPDIHVIAGIGSLLEISGAA